MPVITSTESGASGRYINLGSPSTHDNIGAQTIIVYCKPTSAGGGGTFGYLFGKTTADGSWRRLMSDDNSGSNPRIQFGVSSTSTNSPAKPSASNSAPYNSWVHAIVTWDGSINSSGINDYINNVLSNGTGVEGSGSLSSDAAGDIFLLNRNGLGREFNGSVAYIAWWNRVLNSTERAQVYATGPLDVPSGMLLCWANGQDYSSYALTPTARSTRVTGDMPPNTALGGGDAVATSGTGTGVGSGTGGTASAGSNASVPAATGTGTGSGTGGNATGITLSGNYERSSVNIAASSVSGSGDSAIISIMPKMQESEVASSLPTWVEPSVDVTGVNGIRPTFRFLSWKGGSGGYWNYSAGWATTRRPMYSYDDGLTWNSFDTNVTLDSGNEWIQFRHSTPFTSNKVRISRDRQITVHQTGDWIAAMDAAYSFFNPSASAIAYTPSGSVSGYAAHDYIAAEYSAQTDSLGATVPVAPFYACEINDTSLTPTGGGAKRLAITMSGVHACEDIATWSYLRAIEYLCGSSAAAIALRQEYRILVYPCINSIGRSSGAWRGSWTQGTAGADDANRHFHESGSALEIVDKPKACWTTDFAGQTPDWMWDAHAQLTGGPWSYSSNAVASSLQTRLVNKISVSMGFTLTATATGLPGNSSEYIKSLGVPLAHSSEVDNSTSVSDGQLTTFGEAHVDAFKAMMDEGAFFAIASAGTGTGVGAGTGGNAIGQINASVPSSTGTGAGSGTGGSAAGASGGSASVPAATGTGTGSGTGGSATGAAGGSASITAATGAGIGSGTGGSATGQTAATVPSATGTGPGSGTGGSATGGTASATASGGTGTGTGSGTGGSVVGPVSVSSGFGPDLDVIYAMLATPITSPAGNFLGFLDSAEVDMLEYARAGTHALRYLDSIALPPATLVTGEGQTFKVVGQPRRINNREYIADLVAP